MQSTSIILADKQVLIRKGLKYLISRIENLEIIGEANDSDELFDLMQKSTPDLLIIDYKQKDAFSLKDILKVKDEYKATEIIVLSGSHSKSSVDNTISLGINSFLTKQCDEEEVKRALETVMKGDRFYCSSVLDLLIDKATYDLVETSSIDLLSDREMDVIKLVAKGQSAKDIASELFLSIHTVYTHRKNIYRKLGINSSAELLLFAVNHGIIKAVIE